MYVSPNFASKAALRRAIADGQPVTVFSPGGMGVVPITGTAIVEGPHYPVPHRWYGKVTIVDELVVAVV